MTATPAPRPVRAATAQRRVVRVLSGAQVLGGVGIATGLAVSSLVAASISGSDTVGGLAQTAVVVGAALLALPVARLAARSGRRPSLLAGYGVAAAGSAIAAVATAVAWWPLLLLGLVAFGGGTAAGLASRYAATDLADPARRARDLSIVVWATTIGSVAGPNLAAPAGAVVAALGFPGDAGPYLLSTAAFGAAALAVAVGLRPDPLHADPAQVSTEVDRRPEHRGSARGAGLRALRASPTAQLALAGIVLSHTVMVGLMSMTPVHMDQGGASLEIVGVVISLHVAGMYALSPLVGALADRIGRIPVLALGAVLLVAAAAVVATAPAQDSVRLSVGLVLLGIGWSCGLVAGSALLTESVPAAARTDAQGLSDLAMNAGGALGGVLAGAVVSLASYGVLAVAAGLLVLPLLAVLLVAAARPAAA